MRLCDWFAGIDVNSREVIAAIGSSENGAPPRVFGCRSFAAESGLARDRALREIGDWLRLETGGKLREVAITVPGTAYRARMSRGECRFSAPVEVDDEMIEIARQQALAHGTVDGPILCSATRGFRGDGRTFPEAPLGLTVRSLSIELMNWVADPEYVRSMTGQLDDIGFAPGLIAPRVVALAEAVLSPAERDRGSVVLCVSDEHTEGVVYRHGQLDDLFVVPLGKARRDVKLAHACGISRELVDRIDLYRMFESVPADPIVQRVRTVISAWNVSLMRAVRARLEATGPVWQLRAGVVIADSSQALPLLTEAAVRVIGSAARVATAAGSTQGEPLAVRGSIPLQWRLRPVEPAANYPLAYADADAGEAERDGRRGIGPVIGRWLREFVPADHAP